jgi:hypothetical protein
MAGVGSFFFARILPLGHTKRKSAHSTNPDLYGLGGPLRVGRRAELRSMGADRGRWVRIFTGL